MRKLHNFNYFIMILALFMLYLCSGCGGTDGTIDFSHLRPKAEIQQAAQVDIHGGEKPLRVAFASVMSPQKTRESYQVIVNELSERLHRPVTLLQKKTYRELNMLLSNGAVDIAFLSTGAYASYIGSEPIELLAMVKTNNTVRYHTYVIVPKDSAAKNFSDLRGKVFAFTDPLSYSGRLAVDYLLLSQHATAEQYFDHYFYTYNHDKSLWAVANHLADGASIDSQIYDYMEYTNPHLLERIRILETLGDAPTGPVVVKSSLPEEEKSELQEIFFSLHQSAMVKKALQNAMIDQFVPPEPELYYDLKSKYNLIHNLPER